MQAIERQTQRTIGLVSHAAGEHRVRLHSTRFMVRVWFRAKLQASIERTPVSISSSAGTEHGASHVKR